MKCPGCAKECADAAPECHACGLIFAKYKERQEREKLAAKAALALLESSPAPATAALNPWWVRAVAVGVVVLWILGMMLYARHTSRVRRLKPVQVGDVVPVRDPETGEMRMMKVQPAGQPSRAKPAAAANTEPATPQDGRIIKESTWVEESGKEEKTVVETKKTVLPLPPPPQADDE